jgi:hypothetical protein
MCSWDRREFCLERPFASKTMTLDRRDARGLRDALIAFLRDKLPDCEHCEFAFHCAETGYVARADRKRPNAPGQSRPASGRTLDRVVGQSGSGGL